MAIWPAGPPKLMNPRRVQNFRVCLKGADGMGLFAFDSGSIFVPGAFTSHSVSYFLAKPEY